LRSRDLFCRFFKTVSNNADRVASGCDGLYDEFAVSARLAVSDIIDPNSSCGFTNNGDLSGLRDLSWRSGCLSRGRDAQA
jgi:hypothetical protein